MVDVQHLFLAAIAIRRICAVIILLSIALLWRTKADIKRLLPRMLCIGTALFFALTAALAAIISTDFTKYFILFHKIFFTNDLWILDPSTDLLINIVPEPFFVDTRCQNWCHFCSGNHPVVRHMYFFYPADARKNSRKDNHSMPLYAWCKQ